MYTRKKKYNKDIENKSLIEICEGLLKYNSDTLFATSRSFIVENDESKEIEKTPIIMVNKPVSEVLVGSPYEKVNGDSISYWYDLKTHLARLVYVPMEFRSGKAHERQFLYVDKDEIKALHRKEAMEARRASYK